MLLLLALPVVFVVAHLYAYLQLYAPSNLLIARVRTSPPRWRTAIFLMTLAYALIWGAHYLSTAIESGAPGWLNLVVLVLAWDSLKLALLGALTAMRRLIASAIPAKQAKTMLHPY